jgi:polyphosphate glucokinase
MTYSVLACTHVGLLGIDIGGSGIKAAIVDVETGELTADRYRLPTPKPATPEAIADTVAAIVEHFNWREPFGCAFPARIRHGVAMTASNIDPAWIGTNVEQLFSNRTGLPVAVLNDADAAGMAEVGFGAAKNRYDTVLLLTFGTGIGSALFVNQNLVPNTEFGHLLLRGRIAEHYASDRVREVEKMGWKRWAKRVQEYLDRVEFLLGPDLIVLGGGVSKPKKYAKFAGYLKTQAELMPAALQNQAGIVGAAYTARGLLQPSVPKEIIQAAALEHATE